MADRSVGRAAAASLIGLVVAACGLGPLAGEDDPAAPILLTAEVLDVQGGPVPGARLYLQVFDDANAVLGQAEPPMIDAWYTAGGDGTFNVHYEPTPDQRTFARLNGGVVFFSVFVIDPERNRVFPFGMKRELGSDAWAGEPLRVGISPHPEYWHAIDALAPAAQPRET